MPKAARFCHPTFRSSSSLACEALANLVEDDPGKAARWLRIADELQALLVDTLWTGETFAARLAADPERILPGESLIQFMPLLLGSRLPAAMCRQLVARLVEGAFITDWGPATESPPESLLRGRWLLARTHLGADDLSPVGWTAPPGRGCIGAGNRAEVLCTCQRTRYGRKLRRALGQGAFGTGHSPGRPQSICCWRNPSATKTGEELKPSCSDRP
ncbi:hypothetical protein Q1M64_11445 (plasmid) [Sinorhizobium meliloti]|nr:hypothetical protein Q1M64_11445 [Sinorhizobium meliloti]